MFGWLRRWVDRRVFVIKDQEGNKYLTRVRLFQWRKDGHRIYLHVIHKSDDDREMHDHPWWFVSFLLWGNYVEHLREGARRVRWINAKLNPAQGHKLELNRRRDGSEKAVVTLVIGGPNEKEWGFYCPAQDWKGPRKIPTPVASVAEEPDGCVWVSYRDFLDRKFGPGKWSEEFE